MRLTDFALNLQDLTPAFMGHILGNSVNAYDYSMICKIAKEKNDSLTPDELSFCIADFLAENRESVMPVLAHDQVSSERY